MQRFMCLTIVNPQELIGSRCRIHKARFAFTALLIHKLVDLILFRVKFDEDFHNLELCMPKPRVACLGSTVAPLIQGSGLIDTRIHARKGGQKPHDV